MYGGASFLDEYLWHRTAGQKSDMEDNISIQASLNLQYSRCRMRRQRRNSGREISTSPAKGRDRRGLGDPSLLNAPSDHRDSAALASSPRSAC